MTVMPETLSTTRNVSNSEVTSFLSCVRMYDYAFVRNLAPKITSRPLSRGTLGHGYFEAYIEARLNSATHDQALKVGSDYLLTMAKSGSVAMDEIMEVKFLCDRYMEHHKGWPEWKLLGTEERVDLTLTDTLSIAIRYDLLVEDVRTGKHMLGDFKFTYDFWQPEDHELNGQMPKYIGVLQANGIKCDGGFIEEIRTRPLGKDKARDPKNLWRRTTYFPTIAKRQSVLRQHVAASLKIESYRNLPDAQRIAETIPVLNKHGACKYCNFKDLCNSENEGKTDLSVDIQSGYIENTYGYNKTVMEELL